MCRKLDARLDALVRKFKGSYTRYADDITVSFPAFGRNRRRRKPQVRQSGLPASPRRAGASRRLLGTLRGIIEDEGFQIQMKKRVRVQRPHQRQTATGLVVNRKIAVPRATRRLVRAMQHRARLGQLDAAGQQRLHGLESWLAMVARQRER